MRSIPIIKLYYCQTKAKSSNFINIKSSDFQLKVAGEDGQEFYFPLEQIQQGLGLHIGISLKGKELFLVWIDRVPSRYSLINTRSLGLVEALEGSICRILRVYRLE